MLRRIALAHLPTPLQHLDALDRLVGTEVWLKRDDFSGGATAGNKIRKLEFLLAEALNRSCTHVLTCGAEQSNHARATALLAAQLGLRSVLLLRTVDVTRPPVATGNILLDQLAGARIVWVDAQGYQQRDRLLAEQAAQMSVAGAQPYVIPEGGSNGLGAMGYVDAMREIRQQLDIGLLGSVRDFDAVVVPCGSGGTAAGTSLGASLYGIARRVLAIAVCADAPYFRDVIDQITLDARASNPQLSTGVPVDIFDDYRGPDYGVASADQLSFMVDVACNTGLVLDPVYTGKALYGLSRLTNKPKRVLFIHTGGLPGALAQAQAFSAHVRVRE